MKTSMDLSVQLAWQLANAEALSAGDTQIQPVHFFLGILKVLDSGTVSQVRGLPLPAEALKSFEETVRAGRQFLEMPVSEITSLRRGIRKLLCSSSRLKPTSAPEGFLHRSEDCRALFDNAACKVAKAPKKTVTVVQLLDLLLAMRLVDLDDWRRRIVP